MGAVGDHFYEQLLAEISAPKTRTNLQACHAWQAAEGGSATWNPWNTTQPAKGASDYNSAHVKNYPDRETGLSATVRTLKNGRYGGILLAFRKGTNGLAICEAVDSSPWGTKHAASVYRSKYGNT
jgi:hypothetical protein